MKKLGAIILLGLILSGCSLKTSVEDLRPMTQLPLKSSDNPFGIKISGGSHQNMTGSNVDLEVSIGLRDRTVSGTNVDAQISISTHRPDPL